MKIISANKRANFDYTFNYKIDAGIVLSGSEVKSLRINKPSLKESYIQEKLGELWICNFYIQKYISANDDENNPKRDRKLLVSRKELNKLIGSIKKDGCALVPITLYFNNRGLAKLSLGLGKGKKKYDKRDAQKTKDWNIKKQRLLKNN